MRRLVFRRRYHFVCDLGQDKVLVYTLDSEAGRVRECAEVALEPTQVRA
jgi:6-phosphogluconolactonase (cycloisomerase 2 family)